MGSKVLITGGSGLIGRHLTRILLEKGHLVHWLSRHPLNKGPVRQYAWDIDRQQLDPESLVDVDTVIHLAGTGIVDKRWSPQRKKEILDTRTRGIALVNEHILRHNLPVTTQLGTSAIGAYGAYTTAHIFKEEEAVASDFLSQTCQAWEAAYAPLQQSGCRTVIIRVGVVLDREGGALQRLLPLFRAGLGSAVGHGRQYMPWIHSEDIAAIFYKAMTDPAMQGVYNAASPFPVTNRAFSKELAKQVHRPFFMPAVPAFLLKGLYGEMALALLEGSRVSVDKLLDSGYHFQYPHLPDALQQLLTVQKR